VLFALFVLLRLGLVNRHGLWADELFSLAIATGHSLEHPPAQADPALGDYIEAPRALPPAAYSRYLKHDSPPAGPERVVRAVFLSDTSPPLYYLLLYAWTRALGTGDAALRLFSVAWALASLPVVLSLARRIGGRASLGPTYFLFTLSPVCIFYSTEGRMYSLLWFWTVAAMWLALELRRRGLRPGLFLLWVAVGAAGLLTHYFFAFVWAAAVAWLGLHPRRLSRWSQVAGVALVGLLVLPWFAYLPESLAAWRATDSWLKERPADYYAVLYWLYLPWSNFSIHGIWGVPILADLANVALFLTVFAAVWKRLGWSLFTPRRRLLWLWLMAACLGPIAFDLLKGTYIVTQARYAIAGMPAAFLLLGLGLGRLPARQCRRFLLLIGLAWLLAIARFYVGRTRAFEPFPQVGQLLAAQAGSDDLVLVHSIPSGVAGVARYMETAGASPEVHFASWTGQLKQRRVPDDLLRLAAGRKRVIIVKLHEVDEPAPEEDWLRQHAVLDSERQLYKAWIISFVPSGAETFREPEVGSSAPAPTSPTR
jgi:hypothetical protein